MDFIAIRRQLAEAETAGPEFAGVVKVMRKRLKDAEKDARERALAVARGDLTNYRINGTRKLSQRIADFVIESDGSKTIINGYSDRC